MLISIIIPYHNRSHTIIRCIKSVIVSFEKFYNSLEIILIDDCSTDHTSFLVQDYLKKFKINYKIFTNYKNLGSNFSRNVGFRESRGDWCILLDSDDELFICAMDLIKCFKNNNQNHFLSFQCMDKNHVLLNKQIQPMFEVNYDYYINNYHKVFEKLDCINLKMIGREDLEIFEEKIFLGCEFVSWARFLKKNRKNLLINQIGRIYHNDVKNQITKLSKRKRSNDFYNAYRMFYLENKKGIVIKTKLQIVIRLMYYFVLKSILNLFNK